MRPLRHFGFVTLVLGCADPVGTPSSQAQPTDTIGTTDTPDTPDTDTPSPDDRRFRWFLHGGGPEDDAIFQRFVDAADRGDIVTLGAVEDATADEIDWWNGYFVGLGARSAHTVNTLRRDDANDAAAALVDEAEGVFMRGGDQSLYVTRWAGTPLGDALTRAADRGALIGGSSAGCAMLGQRIYDAREGSVDPWEILHDPDVSTATFTDSWFGGVPGVITDTHLTERGRQLRLAAFLAAWMRVAGGQPTGLGVDPRTALLLREDGTGEVLGLGSVLILRTEIATVASGSPLDVRDLRGWQLPAGYEISLNAADPVTTRPAWVTSRPVQADVRFPDATLDGDRNNQRQLGEWTLEGAAAPYAFVDRRLRTTAGQGQVGGALVLTRLYGDPDLAESTLGGAMWAMGTLPGVVVLGVDVRQHLSLSAPAIAAPAPGDWAAILDARGVAWRGEAPPPAWQTAAVEDFRLHILGDASRPLDLR